MAALSNRRALVWLCVLFFWSPLHVPAAEKNEADLPLQRVVLFTSGVGYYEHGGKVQGNAAVELRFNVADVNDLLKSMVLEDAGGGRIAAVTYGSRDPITKTLRTFSVDLTGEPTVVDLLRQIRGEQIRVETLNGAVSGKILGVERRQQKVGKDETLPVDVLNLLTPTGLRTIPFDTISEFRLLSEKLNDELQEALQILAQGHDRDKKTVTLKFLGAGQRPVRVGYIQEAPLWKTSYRLVLKKEGPPLLQGWAIVENATEHDWQDVRLTLVSGRPVSFKMDLYQPLYVARPEVEPETFATLRPQVHNQDLAGKEDQFQRAARNRGFAGGMGGGMGGMAGKGGGGYFGAPPLGDAQAGGQGENGQPAKPAPFDPGAGVQSAAQGDKAGELFRYQIDEPVTIVRQQSAMLPIVNESAEAEKVWLYNASVQASHPMNAVRLSNTTNLHLMQGPITVFDGGEYAGDAQIEDLSPGARRLITYALDLETEIVREAKPSPDELAGAKLAAGTLEVRRRSQRSTRYTIKNSGDREKKILIEQPIDAPWKLSASEAAEKTRSLYRFAVTAAPGKPAQLLVEEELVQVERVALTTLGDEKVAAVYLRAGAIGPAIKQAIQEVIRRKQTLADLAQQRQLLENQVAIVEKEQERIRKNMDQLDHSSELYQRYVTKFGAQEDQVEELRPKIEQFAKDEAKALRDLQKYIEQLNLD